MLQQILKDMYIDPEILEELSEDQKQILFFKMREEQIRRWKVWNDKLVEEEESNPKSTANSKKVHFNKVGSEEEIVVEVITEPDEEDIIRKQEEEALKRAEEKAKKESEEKRIKLEVIAKKEREDAVRKEEEEKRRKEAEKLREEALAEANRLAEEARLQKEKEEREKAALLEEENRLKVEGERKQAEEARQREELRRIEEEKRLEEQRRLQEEKRAAAERQRLEEEQRLAEERRVEEENRLKLEKERKQREEELAAEEDKRKEEIYRLMQAAEEEKRREDEEAEKRLEEEWKEREKKAKEAEKQRRNSFSASKKEFERMRKLEKERAELEKVRRKDAPNVKMIKEESSTTTCLSGIKNSTTSYSPNPSPKGSPKTRKSLPKSSKPQVPGRPDSLPRPTISMPVTVTSTRDEVDTIPIKKEVVKPSRPPPPPSGDETNGTRKDSKTGRPPRPKSKNEVIKWYKETEYAKSSGLDEDKNAMEWFHGVITRQESERLLSNKKQGAYLVRVSERVWGYTISYKDIGRCKHFLVDTIHGGYQFFGMDQLVHHSLNELIEHHKVHPISGLGKEVLVHACGQERSPPDYEHLFADSTVYNI